MKNGRTVSVRSLGKSIRHALGGLLDILRTEHNAKVHAVAAVVVIAFSVWLRLRPVEWCLVGFAIAGVWSAEALNTVFEILTDMISPNYSEGAKRAKDIGAAAVLISAAGALLIGGVVLLPALIRRLSEIF